MISRSTIKLNTRRMEELRVQLATAKGSYVKVGILGDSADRGVVPLGNTPGPLQPSKLNNPTIGLIQEKGSVSVKPPIPRRSFLQIPLETQMPARIKAVGAARWEKLIIEKGPLVALQFLGVEAENVVQVGFDTRGYGRWAPNAPYTIRKKGVDNPLIDSAQMRNAIHSAVVKGRS